MNPYLETAIAIAIFLGHGIKVTISWILYPFTPLWYAIYILLLPLIHIGQAAWALVSYPARVFPGSLVETMYIYLSSAVLIGIFTGGLLLFLQHVFTHIFKLNQPSEPAQKPAKRSMKDHREHRTKRKESIRNTPLTEVDDLGYVSPKSAGISSGHMSPLASPNMTDSQLKWARRSLIASPSIILEEGSSDDYF